MTQKSESILHTLRRDFLFPQKRANNINFLSLSIHDTIQLQLPMTQCVEKRSKAASHLLHALCSFHSIHKLQTEKSHTTNNSKINDETRKSVQNIRIRYIFIVWVYLSFPFCVWLVVGLLINFVRSTTRDVGSNGRSSHSICRSYRKFMHVLVRFDGSVFCCVLIEDLTMRRINISVCWKTSIGSEGFSK